MRSVPRLAPIALSLSMALGFGCSRQAPESAGPASSPRPSIHVVFQTDWYAVPEHGGYYQALARGFYRQAGLDVEISQGGPGGFALQKVATGKAQFCMEQSDTVALAIAHGLPLTIVSAQLQHDPQALFVHDDDPVRSLKDLQGRTVRAVLGASWTDYVKHQYGIDFALVPVDYGHAAFIGDPHAIQQGYLTSDGFLYAQQKVRVRCLPIFESGYDPYRVIVAQSGYVRAHPEVVRAFVEASNRGWNDFMGGDPRPAEELIAHEYPVSTLAYSEYSRSRMRESGLVSAPGVRTGSLDPRRLERQLRLLHRLGVLKVPLEVNQVATFDFAGPR